MLCCLECQCALCKSFVDSTGLKMMCRGLFQAKRNRIRERIPLYGASNVRIYS